MKHVITLIPGDGTGPEISAATTRVVEATGADIDWDIVNAGAEVYEKEGTVLPDNVIESLKKNKVGLKGP
ncbi:MAG: isocitrate/isopropylmalate family dehydrogenase, partial [Actinobacteria bacterium]|nr:isocitrate/isopropylmalate family dehydrogenase [Actinomycetota bacterium]